MTSAAGGRAGEGSLQIMYGIGGEHDLSERELPHLRGWRDSHAGARRQRRLEPGPARRLRRAAQRAARLPRAARRPAPGDPGVRRRPRRHRGAALARDGLGHLGDARRAAPPPLLEGHVLGRARPRREARAAARRAREGRRSGRPRATRCARRSSRRGWSEAAPGLRAVVRLRRARRRAAADADLRLPARDGRAHALDDRGDRARPDRGRAGAALPRRGGPERRRADAARRARS